MKNNTPIKSDEEQFAAECATYQNAWTTAARVAKPARRIFDLIRNGRFRCPSLETQRQAIAQLSELEIHQANADIQDATSESQIATTFDRVLRKASIRATATLAS